MSAIPKRLVALWESTQVELQGSYSPQRVLLLAKYTRETSWLRVISILVVTPLPCLIVTVWIDALPLANPSEGLAANGVFLFREYYSYVVMSFLAFQQFRTGVPELPYPNKRLVVNTVIVAALSVGVLYAMTLGIGFPLPFTIVSGMPAWLAILSTSLVIEWAKKIRENPETWALVVNMLKVWMCEVALVVIYPPYFYIFTTLSSMGKMGDEMPEVVVFNSEVFNTLFVSYCMQNSPSIGTTLSVMGALLLQMVLSLRDVNIAVEVLEHLGRQLEQECVYQDHRDTVVKSSVGGHVLTVLERAIAFLQEETPANKRCQDQKTEQAAPIRHLGGASVQPAPQLTEERNDSRKLSSTTVQYTQKVRQLLYLTEFLVLINYVGVIIPLIFTTYLGVMYRLPNRAYYSQLADLTEGELYQALQNVMFNCSLKVVSLALLCWVLQYKLHFSAIHQLAFVLEKQWAGVQIKLAFWVFYNVQASLQHYGAVSLLVSTMAEGVLTG
ncbi:hypothetical protein BBJ28_00025315 [Nothophytophthora sp. Chile5]|nr:hypothetical protein BBJ28_00025315 [Nothophytophthora sp. Chile5]